jgi:hypothetical protein
MSPVAFNNIISAALLMFCPIWQQENSLPDASQALAQLLTKMEMAASQVSVSDRPPRKSTLTFAYQDLHHPAVKRLRRKYSLDRVIENGQDEFHKMLLLREWAHKAIPGGNPTHGMMDAEAILDAARRGGTFWCTQYAWVFMSCAVALGWQARKMGVDCFHSASEDSTHHGVAEIWSNQYAKWCVMDPLYDIHYEKDGVPLCALELRNEFLKNACADVETRMGPARGLTAKGAKPGAFDSPSCYFWFLIASRNDFFSMPEKYGNYRSLLYLDSANKGHVWYQGKGTAGQSYPHKGYLGMFLPTERVEDVYPDIGTAGLEFKEGPRPREVTVVINHFTPNFSRLVVEMNRTRRKVAGDAFVWRLRKGENALSIRTVNLAGVEGPVSTARVVIEG